MKIFRSFFKLHQSGILAFVLCSIVFVLIFSLTTPAIRRCWWWDSLWRR